MSRKIIHKYVHTSLKFLVSKIGLNIILAQLVFLLRTKLWEVVEKYENLF